MVLLTRRHGIRARSKKRARNAAAGSARTGAAETCDEEIPAQFTALPPRYFQIHTAGEILVRPGAGPSLHRAGRWETAEQGAFERIVGWQDEPNRGYNLVKVCTWDRAGLFSRIAGSFSATGLNILSAQIFTRSDGVALDAFFVNDARTGNIAAPGAP